MGEQRMTTLSLPIGSEDIEVAGSQLGFPGIVGFFFVFRICLNFLFFQGNLILGSAVSFAIDCVLLFCAVLYSVDVRPHHRLKLFGIPTLPWILAYLMFSILSVFWTGAQSPFAAAAYWTGMTIDVLIVLLLLRYEENALQNSEGILKGVVLGTFAISLVAWCSPTTADLRLGNDEFLHPNSLGLELGIATLTAQYLASRSRTWKWLGIALAITLLRTLSKTAIAAFLIAEGWYLLQDKEMTRKTKARLCAGAAVVVASFWGVLQSYLSIYNNTASGNQAETLTGRTLVWTIALSMGLERPWFGHGIYSFRSVVPAIGIFQPVHAHNEFLQQFFEFGLVGVIVVALIYWSLYRQAWLAPKSALRSLCIALLIFSLVRGLADAIGFGLSYPLWLMAGLSIVLARSQGVEVSAR
jgi:exopolysaccharide production protein ExoQ